MTTRKQMIIGGLAAIITSQKCPAVIRKACLGNANLAEKKNIPSAAEYISDGLVVMWDARENAGFNEHDPYPETWIDLAGNGLDLTVNNEMGTFTNDRVIFNPAKGCFAWRETGRADLIALGVTDLPTVEIVHLNVDYWGCLVCFGYLPVKRYHIYNKWGTGAGLNYWKRKFPMTNTICSFSCSEEIMTMNGLDCGEIDSSANVMGGGGVTYTHFSVKGYAPQNNGVSDFYNEVCCIRAYQRPLSIDEILYNYSIDKMRFGI